MPIYLVRWDDGDCEMIRARDESHLFGILDEVSDPFAACFCVWEGGVRWPFRIETWEGCEQPDVSTELDGAVYEILHEVRAAAFPKTAAAVQTYYADLDKVDVRDACQPVCPGIVDDLTETPDGFHRFTDIDYKTGLASSATGTSIDAARDEKTRGYIRAGYVTVPDDDHSADAEHMRKLIAQVEAEGVQKAPDDK